MASEREPTHTASLPDQGSQARLGAPPQTEPTHTATLPDQGSEAKRALKPMLVAGGVVVLLLAALRQRRRTARAWMTPLSQFRSAAIRQLRRARR